MIQNIPMLLALFYASYTDSKTFTIPVWLFPTTLCFYFFIIHPDSEHLSGMLIGIPVFLLCLAGKMGGGDLLMFLTVGYVIGIYDLIPFAIFMNVTGTINYVIKRDLKQRAVAPLVTSAFVLFLIFHSWIVL